MLTTARGAASSLSGALARKCSRPFVLLLLHVEKAIFQLLYLLSVMENGGTSVNDELNFGEIKRQHRKSEEHEPFENIEMKRLSMAPLPEEGELARSVSLPNVQDVGKPHAATKQVNPVKEFISNFVSRGRGPKKRAPIRHSVTAEDFTIAEEKVEVKRQNSGKGHVFLPCHLRNPTWCDLCGEFIWGLFKQSVRCKSKYITHEISDAHQSCTKPTES